MNIEVNDQELDGHNTIVLEAPTHAGRGGGGEDGGGGGFRGGGGCGGGR